MGLTNNQQAFMVLISSLLIAFSVVSVPNNAPWYVTFSLALLGAAGLTIKEFLGSSTPSPSGSSVQSNLNTNSGATAITAPSPSVQLPPLPQGFSLTAARANGTVVYENTAGDVILKQSTQNAQGQTVYFYTDIYGNKLTNPTLVGYTQLT